MKRLILCVTLLVVVAGSVQAQKKQKRKATIQERVAKSGQPTSIDPNRQPEEYTPKASKKKKGRGVTYDARDDFEKRMEKNWKRREKEEKNFGGERKADKSLPPYFGHKRPPKIRPIGKRKLCKVCGIVH